MHTDLASSNSSEQPPCSGPEHRPTIRGDGGTVEQGATEPVPDGPAAPDPVAETSHLERIDATLAALAHRMELEADRAAFRERVIDRLHADVERLRAVERTGLLRPVVTDLCRLRNDLLRQAATVPHQLTGAQVATLLGSFADVVEQALERCGVAVVQPVPGSAFAAGRQQVVSHVDVEEPALDGTVAAVVQDGYAEIDGGKVVAPARITLHRAVQVSPGSDPADAGTTDDMGTKESTDD